MTGRGETPEGAAELLTDALQGGGVKPSVKAHARESHSVATGVAKQMHLDRLRRIAIESPPARCVNIVDDLTAHVVGGPATACEAGANAHCIITSEFAKRPLPVNVDAPLCVISDTGLLDGLEKGPR